MIASFFIFFLSVVSGLKTWIPNTDANNRLNWEKKDTPKDCDNIRFEVENDVAAFWNLMPLTVSGLSLPRTGNVIVMRNTEIQFRDPIKCPQSRDMKYIRNRVKGWLDPDNWESDLQVEWQPHVERVPCTGESIRFPPQQTISVQLPSIMLPINEISFDGEIYRGDSWPEFLRSELGFQLFKGPDDLRGPLPWRTDDSCLDNKNCICARSPYIIRNGMYKDTSPHVFQDAVCLYAMPKCKPSKCYFPVVPDGHCCGICGAVITLQDYTENGLRLSEIKKQVEAEHQAMSYNQNIKTYTGRKKDGDIQIVIVAENSEDTFNSHLLADSIIEKLKGQQLNAKMLSRVSGLTFSNYIFNGVSGAVFGTLFAVIMFFASIFYIFTVLPKKKFQKSGGNPFMFARFDNTLHEAGSEENLEIGAEPKTSEEPPQAFDNPLYSGTTDPSTSKGKVEDHSESKMSDNLSTIESTSTKEYSNPVYKELEKCEKLNMFEESLEQGSSSEYTEIKL